MVLAYIILVLIAIVVGYLFTFSLGSLFYRTPKFTRATKKNKIAIYIPAYKEDAVIVDSVKNVLKQQYHLLSHKKYDIIVVAQHLQNSTIQVLNTLDCIVVEYNVEQSTKVKALQYAIKEVDPTHLKYDIAIILDGDNHLKRGFLNKINDAYSAGHRVIQGHRTAKNLNTRFAYLDALAEEMNNSIFRKGFNFFKLSASIIGSGVAFDNRIFVERINASNAIAGFDKEIDNEIVSRQEFILYLNDAIVLDEKVQSQEVFEKQRTRWIEAQLSFAKRFTGPAIKSVITTGNVDFLMKAFQNLLPQRILLLGALFFIALITLLIDDKTIFIISLILAATYVLTLCIAIPRQLWSYQLLDALIKLPNAFWSMAKSWFKLKSSKKEFIHTPHGVK